MGKCSPAAILGTFCDCLASVRALDKLSRFNVVASTRIMRIGFVISAAAVTLLASSDALAASDAAHAKNATKNLFDSEDSTDLLPYSDNDTSIEEDEAPDDGEDSFESTAGNEERLFWLKKPTNVVSKPFNGGYTKFDRFLYKFFQKVLPGSIKDP